MKKNTLFFVMCGAILSIGSVQAATITVGDYDFDLGQFADASVALTVGAGHSSVYTSSNELDQLLFFNPYAVGDMVNSGTGDVVSLGAYGGVDSLALSYGSNGFYVGPGDSRFFVVYEATSATSTPDTEGTAFDITFDGGVTWVDASLPSNVHSVTVKSFHANTGDYPNQNQIVFDLTSFGFNIGDLIDSVSIRNRTDKPSGSNDPDFTFIGHAGTSTPPVVPLPAPVAMGFIGLVMAGVVRRRKARAKS